MCAPDGRVSGFAERREGTDLEWTRLAPERRRADSGVSHAPGRRSPPALTRER
jgi:hypothetical protein